MEKVLNLYKKEGETPLETTENFRKENSEYEKEKMTYAGRLDPMAEGVLLVLSGEECKNKEEYLNLDKEYEFEILWGIITDTYDILGIPKIYRGKAPVDLSGFGDVLKKLKGKQVFEYPPYSSATVEGKQLFQWAREGRLNEIEIPRKEVEIYNIELLENYEISGEELLKSIINRVQKVTGDFRQKEITKQWQLPGALPLGVDFVVSKVRVNCSRGTYVRAIANKLGNDLGVGAIALKIKRNKVGEYNIKNSR
ncbi:hypothetical protein A2442_01655 [Candidatus Campbellbacteria bacterium RIFOXYC2_FULL_35_25]|uniref:tRNA pseudouridine(55) synthase n=1 Tax=Candidatus Campbellbacteria bacterium RIFOXYC2_FULL_35_25 TaxID=1797582 RepID=A0A1F5EHC6_9BACT|nr:MAG: hypothetical protein A2442_01655 [Candidatus Campbellbacteria bacterium RIFOXYC2_FULL_35_25]